MSTTSYSYCYYAGISLYPQASIVTYAAGPPNAESFSSASLSFTSKLRFLNKIHGIITSTSIGFEIVSSC